ncbi:MAG: endonuclease III [Geobacteraceae bacterium GWC2_55_20]|nr:MAG: endonuclease III [Geobacteraceae bacterium GWC2_55_20]OGU20791.1 MAG: endonuclease III [Geobacteraceae bacterium GWF2_54_21]HBA72371.1 endonuclease III [Geobacter sp.]HCE67442.1 endonuclease III [Geobacter sp.]
MNAEDIHTAITLLREEYTGWRKPAVTIVAQCERSPYKVLVSCIISLRTKDEVTAKASERLFARAATPAAMAALATDEIAELIYPAGFYRNKSEQIHEISRRLISEYDGKVPDEIDELLAFKGVGRKTANLVLTLGFGKQGICVDTHVHRICNRWGYVTTRTPEETEIALRAKLPEEYWIPINDLLVAFGQNVCVPVSPRCSVCRLRNICSRAGVLVSR